MSFWFWQWICGNRLKLVNRRLIQPFLIGYKKWVVLTKYNGLQQLHNTSSCKHASLMVILAILFNQQMDYNNYKIKINENIPKWLFSLFLYPVQHTKKIITLEMNSISNSDFHKIGLILKILLFPRTALMCRAITPSHKNYLSFIKCTFSLLKTTCIYKTIYTVTSIVCRSCLIVRYWRGGCRSHRILMDLRLHLQGENLMNLSLHLQQVCQNMFHRQRKSCTILS